MNREFQQFRFARIEAQNITRALLEAQFKNGIGALEEVEKTIEQLIMTEPTCTPWRTSEAEQAASRDGTRMAALEFYWAHRRRRQSGLAGAGSSDPKIERAWRTKFPE